jgi:DNA repair protein RecN (Recombination protein N)
MLIKLSIRNIVVIKKIDLDFIKGLNVLTGETGAGKSIILQSLQLLSGNRANYQLISPNEKEASVSGFFLLPHQHLCFHVLDELSIGYQYTEPLSLRRVLNSSGTSRCFINDEPVSLNALKLLGQNIINIHGQFDCLLDRSYQQQLLDEMVSKENVLQTKKSYHLWKEKEKELANQLIHLEQSKSKKEYWKQVYDDLATIHLKNGEIENLLNQQNLLKPISHIFHALEQTKKHLHFPNHCIEQLYTACKFLQRIDTKNFDDSNKESEKKSMSVSESGSTHLSWITDLIDLQSVIDQCCEQAQIMSNSLEELLGKLANERYHLNQIDERLYQLRGIAKRYNNTIDGTILARLS